MIAANATFLFYPCEGDYPAIPASCDLGRSSCQLFFFTAPDPISFWHRWPKKTQTRPCRSLRRVIVRWQIAFCVTFAPSTCVPSELADYGATSQPANGEDRGLRETAELLFVPIPACRAANTAVVSVARS